MIETSSRDTTICKPLIACEDYHRSHYGNTEIYKWYMKKLYLGPYYPSKERLETRAFIIEMSP